MAHGSFFRGVGESWRTVFLPVVAGPTLRSLYSSRCLFLTGSSRPVFTPQGQGFQGLHELSGSGRAAQWPGFSRVGRVVSVVLEAESNGPARRPENQSNITRWFLPLRIAHADLGGP